MWRLILESSVLLFFDSFINMNIKFILFIFIKDLSSIVHSSLWDLKLKKNKHKKENINMKWVYLRFENFVFIQCTQAKHTYECKNVFII